MNTPERSCLSKTAYQTELIARADSDRMLHLHGWSSYAYQCAFCSSWHLATTTTPRSRPVEVHHGQPGGDSRQRRRRLNRQGRR